MTVANGAGGSFAYDVSAVNRLKYSAQTDGDKASGEAARQFEAMFLKQMLGSMRDAMPKSDLLGGSNAEKQYQDMMDAQWAQTLSERGMGLADMVHAHMTGGQSGNVKPSATDTATASRITGVAEARPQALGPSESLTAIRAQREAAQAGGNPAGVNTAGDRPVVKNDGQPMFTPGQGASMPVIDLTGKPAVTTPKSTADMPAHVREFVDTLGEPASHAAQQTGLSPRLILAQAALETGWGRHETMTETGEPSFNVFNIKATGWQGKSTQVSTHEFVDGKMQSMRDGFRVYDSYDQAFDDYARLINSSPRYAEARQADSAEAAARALQSGGYATDPSYADKLVSVMHSMPEDAGAAATTGGGSLFGASSGPLVDLNARSPGLA